MSLLYNPTYCENCKKIQSGAPSPLQWFILFFLLLPFIIPSFIYYFCAKPACCYVCGLKQKHWGNLKTAKKPKRLILPLFKIKPKIVANETINQITNQPFTLKECKQIKTYIIQSWLMISLFLIISLVLLAFSFVNMSVACLICFFVFLILSILSFLLLNFDLRRMLIKKLFVEEKN